jgi:Tol biopolymer transport system component
LRRPGVIVGIAVAILAVTLWRLTQPVPSHDLRFTQVTFDPGLTGWPAISPDGRTIAYASDRDGNHLDLYVQQIPGGSPVRLTATDDDETEPAFSPDGTTLAYRSTKAGGGIYTVPVAGGEAHLLAAGGRTPRYSPDGRWIAFWMGDDISATAYVVASLGGTPRQFHGEFSSLRAPAWSPDSRSLLFWGRRFGVPEDLWVAPLESGTPESTGLLEGIAKADLGRGPFDDGTWSAEGFLFSARTGTVRNLYRCPLDRHGKASGDIIRLTNGTELMGDAAVSRDGRMVFSSGRQRFDIWGLPLDANTGKVAGAPYRITDTLAPTASPTLSDDGTKLLYGSSRNGFTEVWEKDLRTGKEFVAATSPEGASYGRLLKSGRILFVQPSVARNDVFLLDPSTGQSRKLASGARPWDVDSSEETVLLSGAGIDGLDLATGRRVPLVLPLKKAAVSEASFSRDGRWMLWLAEAGPQATRVYAARPRGLREIPPGEWMPVTEGNMRVDKPRFSPDGRLVYFTLDHDGIRDIEAVAFDPQSGRPAGQPFPVFEPRTPRLSLFGVSPQALEIAVGRDKLVMILCELTSTIWVADTVLQR